MVLQIHPSLLKRKIIHFDMDAFYASIEIRDDPSLKGKPVVVGGSPNSRAVVCTASYEARRFGIKSAMSCARAARLCPQAIFLKPNFEKYCFASHQIREIFRKYTAMVEPLSLDEVYLDVTNNKHGLYAVKIARLIQVEIQETLHLSGSAGVAPNKLLAKIASDIHKPGGLTVVLPEQAEVFMGALPLRRIHGIGPATERHLAQHMLKQCSDVWPFTLEELTERVGSNMAEWLYWRSRGIDERPVCSSRVRKSMGNEETFSSDILDVERLREELAVIAKHIASDLSKHQLIGRTITLKVKYSDFTQITRSRSLLTYTNEESEILEIARQLLMTTEAGQRKIRLLGITVANFQKDSESTTDKITLHV